jgi:hypothetical protein
MVGNLFDFAPFREITGLPLEWGNSTPALSLEIPTVL